MNDQNLPARLLAASDAEILDLPLAVPEAPELSVPNGFGRAFCSLDRSRNMDWDPAANPEAKGLPGALAREGESIAESCNDCERSGVPMGELPDHAFGRAGMGECSDGCGGDGEAFCDVDAAALDHRTMFSGCSVDGGLSLFDPASLGPAKDGTSDPD